MKKDIEENWMMNEYDERVKDYWRISHGNYIVKMIDDKGLEDEVKKLNTMPLHLGVFVLSTVKELWITSFMLLMVFIQMIFITETPIHYI